MNALLDFILYALGELWKTPLFKVFVIGSDDAPGQTTNSDSPEPKTVDQRSSKTATRTNPWAIASLAVELCGLLVVYYGVTLAQNLAAYAAVMLFILAFITALIGLIQAERAPRAQRGGCIMLAILIFNTMLICLALVLSTGPMCC